MSTAARKKNNRKIAAKRKVVATNTVWRSRSNMVLMTLAIGGLLLVGRAVQLQVVERDFLVGQAQARHLHKQSTQAPRRKIVDRNGQPLAISAPTATVWANPRELLAADYSLRPLARLLEIEPRRLRALLNERAARQFIYLKRHLSPEVVARVQALNMPGVEISREYQRFYPMGEVTAHVLGFTDIDDQGQEGIERSYNDHLKGVEKDRRTLRDRRGHVIDLLGAGGQEALAEPLTLSLDGQVQYVAYRELKAATQRHNAKGGSAVVIDVASGEVIAMVNQPGYNPHVRDGMRWANVRNRAVTDVFEPGSTIKPLVIAAALESGLYQADTQVDTGPGWFKVGSLRVKDFRDYGTLDLTGIIRKSSNVGISKIALQLGPERLWMSLARYGFGLPTGSGLPGEASGAFNHFSEWGRVEQATMAYGYGVSVTALQLAQAYTVLAAGGMQRTATVLKVSDAEKSAGEPVISADIARQVLKMMETVTQHGGTGRRAAIPGYRVAGKTGTVRKVGEGGYSTDAYRALFVGVVPVSRPRFVMAIMVDEPTGDYYGGLVAAPVFSKTMSEVLRTMQVPSDAGDIERFVQAGAVSQEQG